MNSPVTKELLFDYFNGAATALQKRLIDQWVTQPENEELFYTYLEEWERRHPQYQVNVPAALDRHRQRVANSSPVRFIPPNPPPTSTFVRFPGIRWYWAAAVLVVCVCGWIYRYPILYQTHSTLPGEIRSWTLPDGSRVTLNANSTLRLPRVRFGVHREVHLTGEAAFSVTHPRTNQPFVVKTNNQLDVVVLGTEFTVYSRARRTQVVLNRGKVRVQRLAGKQPEQITLVPGDLLTVDDGGKLRRNHVADPARYTAWQEHRFVFDNTPLRQVAQLLTDNYGLTVEIAHPEIADWTVSGSFTATDADELLQSVSRALDVQTTRQGKKVIFSVRP